MTCFEIRKSQASWWVGWWGGEDGMRDGCGGLNLAENIPNIDAILGSAVQLDI